MIRIHEQTMAGSRYLAVSDSGHSCNFRALSWEGAHRLAAKYLARSDHTDEGQRIRYTLYLLPDNVRMHALDACKSRNGTYFKGEEA